MTLDIAEAFEMAIPAMSPAESETGDGALLDGWSSASLRLRDLALGRPWVGDVSWLGTITRGGDGDQNSATIATWPTAIPAFGL